MRGDPASLSRYDVMTAMTARSAVTLARARYTPGQKVWACRSLVFASEMRDHQLQPLRVSLTYTYV